MDETYMPPSAIFGIFTCVVVGLRKAGADGDLRQ